MAYCTVNIWILCVLNRLTGWQVQQDGTRTSTHRMAYGANGNLTYLDGTGTLEYAHPQKPYAVTGVYSAGTAPGMGFGHEIEYTSFYRPAYIRGDTAQTEFTYNASGDRVKMAIQATQMNIRYYLGGCYELEPQQGRELLYLGGDAYSAPAVYIKEGDTWNVYYIIRDYLGSICAITGSGGLVAEYSYDPWGNLRDPGTLEAYVPGTEPELFLHRGFTGHEHLTAYGLINMNARLYDPMTGRFLSPDPYVQAPDFSQAFNRFSYCWNNPLRYVDEDGEFLGTIITAIGGFVVAIGKSIGALFSKNPKEKASDAWNDYGESVKTAWRIDVGLFKMDPNKNFWQKTWELTSRFTWQLPQTIIGNLWSHGRNIAGDVDRVDFFGGATFVTNENENKQNGVTLGNYININLWYDVEGNFEDYLLTEPMYMHEYGHYLDSQVYGLSYLFVIGVPSIISAASSHKVTEWKGKKLDMNVATTIYSHDLRKYEMRANKRAKKYFGKYYGIKFDRFKPEGYFTEVPYKY